MGVKSLYFPDTFHLKPREKARALGIESLEDSELLALVFSTGTMSENVVELSERYLREKGGLRGIFLSDASNLESQGVKDAKTYRLLAIREIDRRVHTSLGDHLSSAEDVYHRVKERLATKGEESLFLFYLGRDKEILRLEESADRSLVSVTKRLDNVIRSALCSMAKFVLVCHNHPSGELVPSSEDLLSTTRLYQRLADAKVHLLDSIIIAGDAFLSMRSERLGPYEESASSPLS